jgi:hypothetical protein
MVLLYKSIYEQIRLLLLMILLALIALTSSCALSGGGTGQTYTKTCSIPSDQTGTISGHWGIVPVPLAVHSGDFSTTETAAITSAANSWNAFMTDSKTFNVFSYGGNAASPTTSTNADPATGGTLCSQGIVQGGTSFTGNVIIYKKATWPSTYPASAIALTSFCTTTATTTITNTANNSTTTSPNSYPGFFMAIMEINYQDFFTTSEVPDIQSIVLHELGHVLGLNHSCENFSETGMPLCTTSGLNPLYLSASMYPVFSFASNGAGQVKRSLNTNDEERANCLY